MSQPVGIPKLRPVPWFLATAPSPRAEMLPRPQIAEMLDRGVAEHRAVVVSAPSGFGKTVAVSQWAAARQTETPGSVCWLTLTDRVAGVGDLLRGVVTALQVAAREREDSALHHAVAAAFDAPSYASALHTVSRLDGIAPVIVVIDDFQNAREVVDDSYFADFIENGPSFLRLVLLTTDAVEPALTRLRTYGQIAVIDAAALVLSASDIGELAELAGNSVTPDQAAQLLIATAGWPAAVRLALVGGSGMRVGADDGTLTDYIESAMLGRMRPSLAEFVLATTVVSRVDEELACALSGRTDAARLLSECLTAGLFLERFSDGDDTVYQWHSLFGRHCRDILRRRDPQRWRELNATAARHLAQRHPDTATEHALLAEDADLTHTIIVEHWLEMLLQSRSVALDQLCAAAIRRFGERADLLMIRACCRDVDGDALDARMLFGRGLRMDESPSAQTRFITDLTEVLLSDDPDVMAAAADRALAALGDQGAVSPTAAACALFLLGWANARLRRGESGYRLLETAIHECRALGLTELAERGRQNLSFALAVAGQFKRAMRVLTGPRTKATPSLWLSHDGAGVERFAEGYLRFWRGELEAARSLFVALDAEVGAGYPDVSRMMLAHTAATLGDAASLNIAEQALRRIAATDSHGVPWTSYQLAGEAHLHEARGNHTEALELAAQLPGQPRLPAMSALTSGVCRRLGAPALARVLAVAAKDDVAQPYSQAYALLTLALLDWESGKLASAYRTLESCLTLAAPEAVLYPFLDNAEDACTQLLAAHASQTNHPAFLDSCLAACEHALATSHPETLTPRERQVLSYLRQQLTSNEIAGRMAVSVNTVKTHQRAIYRKLGVTNRREAVRVARD